MVPADGTRAEALKRAAEAIYFRPLNMVPVFSLFSLICLLLLLMVCCLTALHLFYHCLSVVFFMLSFLAEWVAGVVAG